MSSRGSNRITFAKHVYLRTQQRRLRHVKSIILRNLSVEPELKGESPLDIEVFFTIHPFYDNRKTLYRSESVSQSWNPSWESVQFSSSEFGKHSSLSSFTIKFWLKERGEVKRLRSPGPGTGEGGGAGKGKHKSESSSKQPQQKKSDVNKLAFARTLDLSDLVYLGTLVNKDGTGYPQNSVVVGMFEGFYGSALVGGVQTPPPISHSLVDLLPPNSLLEVPRTEVEDSYQGPTLQRILYQQSALNTATVESKSSKVKVQEYLHEQEGYFRKEREKESLKMRIALLQRQIKQQEKLEKEESEGLLKLKEHLDGVEYTLRGKQAQQRKDEAEYQSNLHAHQQQLEVLTRARKSRILRQRNMVYDLSRTFFIKEVKESFTICNVVLPNSDKLDQTTSSVEQFGVALGFAAHLVSHLSEVLLVPLQYPIKPSGSRSLISDHISEEAIIDTIKEFPLFLKGSEKALFLYAVHLLNKDIGQIRQHCGYGASRNMQKKTLPNLKYLLDALTKNFFLPFQSSHPPPSSPNRNSSLPIDTFSESNIIENSHRSRFDKMSTVSSLSSATTPTGLSLTPPTNTPTGFSVTPPTGMPIGLSVTPPTVSTVIAVAAGHENYHRQPVAGQPGGVGGVRTGSTGSGDDGMQNGSLDEGILFRARSNHIAGSFSSQFSGNYPPDLTRNYPAGDVGSVGGGSSSSHERLHYPGVAIETESRASSDERAKTESPTPTPSSSLHLTREPGKQPHQAPPPNSLQGSHDLIYFGSNEDDMREGSPAGAGLFAPLSRGSSSEPQDPTFPSHLPNTAGSNDHISEDPKLTCEPERNGSIPHSNGTLVSQKTSFDSNHKMEFDPAFEESSLEFTRVRRSSKLVDPSDLQIRKERAESMGDYGMLLPPEHFGESVEVGQNWNPEQSLSPVTNSVVFTASGFSRLSPSDEEVLSSTPTGLESSGGGERGRLLPQVCVEQPYSPADLHHEMNKGVSTAGTGHSTDSLSKERASQALSPNSPASQIREGVAERESGERMAGNHRKSSGERSHGGSVSSRTSSNGENQNSNSPSDSPILTHQAFLSGKVVEMSDVSALPLSPSRHTPRGESGGQNSSYPTPPTSLPSLTTVSSHNRHSVPSGVPNSPSPPGPSPPLGGGLFPNPHRVNFPRTPQVFRSSVDTPHIVGAETELHPFQRPRTYSNRLEEGTKPHLHRTDRGTQDCNRSQKSEPSTEFLDDFIDG